MPLDLSKPVQTRDGRKVRILCTDAGGRRPVVGLLEARHHLDESVVWRWGTQGLDRDDGSDLRSVPSDLVNVPEPERIGWLNIYENGHGRLAGGSRADADNAHMDLVFRSANPRIACIEVKYRPGQGLET
jgi:hypothetical protein